MNSPIPTAIPANSPVKVRVPGLSFYVPSSDPAKAPYTVWRNSDGSLGCNCPHEAHGRRNGKPCRHIREIEHLAQLEESGVRFDSEETFPQPVQPKAPKAGWPGDDPSDGDPFADELEAPAQEKPHRLTWLEIATMEPGFFEEPERRAA